MQPVNLASFMSNQGTASRYVMSADRKLVQVPASQIAIQHSGVSGDPLGILTEPTSTNYFPDSQNMTSGVSRVGDASVSGVKVGPSNKSISMGTQFIDKGFEATINQTMSKVGVSFFIKNSDLSTPIFGISYDSEATFHLRINDDDVVLAVSEYSLEGPLADNSYWFRGVFDVYSGTLNTIGVFSSQRNDTKSMYVGGMQVEKERYTSYIPTTGSAASRGETWYTLDLSPTSHFNRSQGTVDLVYTPFPNSQGAALTMHTDTSDYLCVGGQHDVADDAQPFGAFLHCAEGLQDHHHVSDRAGKKNAMIRLCYSGYGVRYNVNQTGIIPFKDFRSFRDELNGSMEFGRAYDGSIMTGYITLFDYHARTFTDTELGEAITEIEDAESLVNRTSAALFRTEKEALAYMNVVEPPTPERVLLGWPRGSNGTYFSDPQDANAGDSGKWYYDDEQYSFVQPINADGMEQIFSPYRIDSYVFEATLTAPGTDDDFLGLVAAADVFDGELCTVIVGVHAGGLGSSLPRFSIRYFDNSLSRKWAGGQVLAGNDILESHWNGNTDGSKAGWSGKRVRLRVIRNGNVISARISDWDGTDLLASSELVTNLASLPRNGSKLTNPARYGFCTNSQAQSTYLDYQIQSDKVIDETKIYSMENDKFWRFSEGNWELQTEAAGDALLPATTVVNIKTKETYGNENGVVTFDTNNGVSEGEATITVPADSVTDIDPQDIISQFEYVDALYFGGAFDESNVIVETVDGNVRIQSYSTPGEFLVLLRTSAAIDDYGIREETVAFRKVNVVLS